MPAKSPTVTILLQSSRTAYFAETLLSILNQSFTDFRVIVGDNTKEALIINSFRHLTTDHRVEWRHSFPVTEGCPHKHYFFLLEQSTSPYTRVVFDDDILHPDSTHFLLAALTLSKAAFACHWRDTIFENSLIPTPRRLFKNELQLLDAKSAAKYVFTSCINIFAEPSFSLWDTKKFKKIIPANIHGIQPKFLGDVINVLDVSELGNLVIISKELGAFRMHSGQQSSESSQ